MEPAAVLSALTLVVVAGAAIFGRKAVETTAAKTTEEVIENYNWPRKLARELQKVRGTERQELRFESYGELWARMRPLAIYDDDPLDEQALSNLARCFSDWYFSQKGGLYLTGYAREFYFALQDVLLEIGEHHGWAIQRTGENVKDRFKQLGLDNGCAAVPDAITVVDKGAENWPPNDLMTIAVAWREDTGSMARQWDALSPEERFVLLQQVSSILRSVLANDIESRLR